MSIAVRLLTLTLIVIIQSCTSDDHPHTRRKILHLKQTGEVTVKPDQANISILLECSDMDLRKSRECLIQKSNELNQDLVKYNLKPEDIVTSSINQYKDYTWRNNSQVFVGYKSSMTTSVTIKNRATLESLYSGLLTNASLTIENLSYTHSKLDSLNNIAYLKALESANNLADQLVKKMDGSEREIIRIANIDLPALGTTGLTREHKLESLSNQAAPELKINTGTMQISKTLVVEYKIN